MPDSVHKTVLVVLVLSLSFTTSAASAADLGLAFWNVENLFDTVDDPKTEGDEEFTPGEPKAWTKTRQELKLTNLARVIGDMNKGRGPDVLGLCEVENRDVVELLAKQSSKGGRKYGIVHQDSPSYRGIDCALLYDSKTMKLVASKTHSVEKFPTRDILEAEFTTGGHSFFVFVNHWPSRRNPDANRIEVASILRRRIDELLKEDPNVDFAVIGDLNDTPSDTSVGKTLRTWSDPDDLHPGVLLNSMWSLHQDPNAGTYVYRNKWFVLDHIILSPGMLDKRGVTWVRDSSHTVRADYQMFVSKTPGSIPRPSRSYLGPRFFGNGYSDHLPVECRLRVGTQ
jgi:endonuclease/exonuclease/phosphatase family metal-dependent hydrolase